MLLNDKQKLTLKHACDTLCPESLFPSAAGNSADSLSHRIIDILATRDVDDQTRMIELLNQIERPLLALLLTGKATAFSSSSHEQRTRLLFAMSRSRVAKLRSGFQVLKRLVLFIAYADHDVGGSVWQEIEYPGHRPPTNPATPPLNIIHEPGDDDQECDILVIGSGAGGAVVAAEMSATGRKVIVVDKGAYFESGFPASELAGMQQAYEGNGLSSTNDLGIVLLAGSTVGGGTAVNWMTSLRPPEQLLTQWRNGFDLHETFDDEFSASLEAVEQRLNVNKNESGGSKQNSILEQGCANLQTPATVIPRNVRSCEECGFCCFGCDCGAKQDVRQTYLADACANGARIIPNCAVQEVIHVSGKVTGALVEHRSIQGETRQFQILAPKVVVAAGSIHTPAILLRSGLSNRNIGRNLCLHPVYAVFGRFPEPIRSWTGPPQTRLLDNFANLDGHGYGVRLEVAPAHPGLWALGLPWRSGEHHRALAKQMHRFANIMVLTRDHGQGVVRLGHNGHPKVSYRIQPIDAKHARRGIVESLRILHAAGAEVIYAADNDADQFPGQKYPNLDAYLNYVGNKPIRPNHPMSFSAHQLSSCRMAGTAREGAAKTNGESWEVENLYVTDGSVLPTSTGVNPMITIMATAHRLAKMMNKT